MRLVDADALFRQVSKNLGSTTMYLPIDFQEEIIDAPTIDAIPVTWLQEGAKQTESQAEPHFAYMYVLHEWQDAKSVEEQQAESEIRDWQAEQKEPGVMA